MEKYDTLKIENQLCFPLYACAKEVVRKYNPYLSELGITYTQYITLMVLWDKNNLNVKDLGSYLYLDSGTLTPLLKKMQSDGLITRNRDEKDERNVIVAVTEKGMQLREKALEIPEKMSSCIPLTQEESQLLYKMLYKVLNEI